MKKFKFFEGYKNNNSIPYNGVTNPHLIALSRDIWSYSDWITSTLLSNNNGTTEDYLIVEFDDIDGSEYTCKISIDGSFEILQVITTEDGDIEVMDTLVLSDETLSDYGNLIQYLSDMPNTIASSL